MSDRDYLRSSWEGAPSGTGFWKTIPATKILLAVMIGIHLVMEILRPTAPEAWRSIFFALNLDPRAVLDRFYVWQLVTATLLHAPGWTHLFFNALIIFFFGRMIEMRLGTQRYLLFALAAAVSASLGYLLFAVLGSHVVPMVGASGAAMGMLTLAALWYPYTVVHVMFVIPAPLWIVAVVIVVIDLVGVLDMRSGIAHAAHLGGALYGAVYYRYGSVVRGLLDRVDRMGAERDRRRARRAAEEERTLREEVDRILEKVGREGMPSLTEQERRFLNEASARFRK